MILITLILIIPIITFLILILSANYIFGQYAGSSNLEEELKLAQEKLSHPQQKGTYSSGYPMLDDRLNCDFYLDGSSAIYKTQAGSNLTFNDSINIISFSQPDGWNSFTILGKIPSLNWDLHALISINNDASASIILVVLPQLSNFVLPHDQLNLIFSSILFSQYFTINVSSGTTFGNNYYGYYYDVSINQEQLDKISLFLPYFPKPFESIVINTNISGNNYLILLSTDFGQLYNYENQFCQMLDSIRFEPIKQ